MTWKSLTVVAVSTVLLALVFRSLRRKKRKHHMNPFVQGINRLKSHALLGAFESDEDARNNVSQIEISPFVFNLGGVWEFRLFRTAEEALREVHNPSEQSLKEPINVPGHWQLQGFNDHPIYTNIQYIIPVEPPNVPEMNPSGYYEREFTVTESWSNRKIVISFGGVDNAFYVWLNHVFIGFSKDSRVSCEFDLTDATNFGGAPNLLQVVVLRFSDGYYLEDQDMWNFSGIFRDVHLISFPKAVHISDFGWKMQQDGLLRNCDVSLEVDLKWDVYTLRRLFQDSEPSDPCMLSRGSPYAGCVGTDWTLSCDLFEEGVLVSSSMQNGGNFILHDFAFDNASDSPICSATTFATRPVGPGFARSFTSWLDKSRNEKALQNLPPDTTTVKMKLNVVSPGLWSAEKPYVYTLVISLRNARDGTIVQAESCRVGFRSVEISDGMLRVNQKPIMVRGVNYHEHDPVSGHNVSSQLLEADLKLMKRNNFNAIRTSHYPQTPMFYELCTLYGFFVVDEANIETHGMKPYAGRLADSLDWERAFMRRVIRMVRCHRNHSCIISWSLGNESGYGRTHDKMASLLRKYESDRVIMYEPASFGPRESNSKTGWFGLGGGAKDPNFKALATDVLCPMYARVEDCIIIANRNPDMPMVLCEYAHMMGNSGGNLDLYWKWFNNFSRLQGGFIWDWADQGLSSINVSGKPIWAYGGDFGESYHDGGFCLNGLNWPDRGLGDALTLARHDIASMRQTLLTSSSSKVNFRANSDTDEAYIPRRRPSLALESPSYGGDGSSPGRAFNNKHVLQLLAEVEKDADYSFWDHMKISRRVYGLQRLMPCSEGGQQISGGNSTRAGENAAAALRANLQTASFSIPVEDAVAKPQLLEAKQCMKVFDCEVTSLHPTVWDRLHNPTVDSSRASSLSTTVTQTGSTTSLKSSTLGCVASPDGSSLSNYQLSITIHYSILNRLSHIKNIEEYLQFDVLLLCDGMIVDRKPMARRGRFGSTNRRHVFDPDDGMSLYMQEVEMLCHFSVPLTRWKPPQDVSKEGGPECGDFDKSVDVSQNLSSDAPGCGIETGNSVFIPPALPLSRCTAASLPTTTPPVVPKSNHGPREKPPRGRQQLSCGTSNVGWTAYGYPWPEDALLSTDGFDHLPFEHPVWRAEQDDDSDRLRRDSVGSEQWPRRESVTTIHEHVPQGAKRQSFTRNNYNDNKTTNAFEGDSGPSLWSDVTPQTKWSTVIVGRLRPDTPWAEPGYPMGFVQSNISGRLIYSLLPQLPNTDSVSNISTAASAGSLPPLVPTPSRLPRVSTSMSEDKQASPKRDIPVNLESKLHAVGVNEDNVEHNRAIISQSPDIDESEMGNFLNIERDEDAAEDQRAYLTNSPSGARRNRLRSRSGSWTEPGKSTVLSQIAAAGAEAAARGAAANLHCLSTESTKSYSSGYEVSVLWVRQDEHVIGDHEKSTGYSTSPDILLRGVAQNLHPEDEILYPRNIEVTIDGGRGTIRSIVCNGNNLLLSEEELQRFGGGMACFPSRFQLHRAPTDNDRMGYLSGWAAAGLDRDLLPSVNDKYRKVPSSKYATYEEYMMDQQSQTSDTGNVPRRSSKSITQLGVTKRSASVLDIPTESAPGSPFFEDFAEDERASNRTPLQGTTELPFLTVVHVLVNSSSRSASTPARSPGMTSSASVVDLETAGLRGSGGDGANAAQSFEPEEITQAFGVTCRWKMSPYTVNSSRVAILRLLNSFAQDTMQQVLVVEVESNASERFVHEIASKLQFGRQSLRPLVKKDIIRSDGSTATILACRLRLWKPVLYMNSTIVKAEDLNMGPYGELTMEEDEEGSSSATSNEATYSVHWEVTYSLSTKGELLVRASLDCSELPVAVPRVGMTLALRSTPFTNTVLWRGLGPHENYPDRTASCVNAVHEAPTASMHTPYIRPSENGSRSGVYWVQLNGARYRNKINRVPKKTVDEIIFPGGSTSDKLHTSPLFSASKSGKLFDSLIESSAESDTETSGCAMTVRCSKLFNFSVQEFSTEALTVASHSTALDAYGLKAVSDLTPRGINLNIDPYLMGVGGDDSWSACVHEEYLIPPSTYSFKVSMSFHYQ